MGDSQKRRSCKKEKKTQQKLQMRVRKRKFSSKKKQLHTITKKKEKNSTIDNFFDKHGNKFLMYETVKEVDEETITKELLRR